MRPSRLLAVPLVTALLAGGCGGGARDRAAGESAFAYDAAVPLDVEDRGGGPPAPPLTVRDVVYASGGDRVEAYLLRPPGDRALPAVLLLPGGGGDRAQLLERAVVLARSGLAVLTLTPPSAGASLPAGVTGLEALRRQRDVVVRDVVAVRRAVDLLAARSDVDGGRLGLVGWSGGARIAALAAGSEPRLRAVVLWSGGALPVSEYAQPAPAELRTGIEEVLGEIDPLRLLARAEADVLLQNGRADDVVPRRALEALAEAAPAGSELRWYEAGHALDDRAVADAVAWLGERLAGSS